MKKLILIIHFLFFIFHFSFGQQGTIQLPATGQTTSYYPGDDGALQKGLPLPAIRFTDHCNGSATDHFTGLMWVTDANLIATRDPSFDQDRTPGDGDVDWIRALNYIEKLNGENYLGHNDWRLPAMNELLSLIDYSLPHTGVAGNHPFINLKQGYWSSTTWEWGRWAGIPVFLKEYRVHSNINLPPGDIEGLNKDLDSYTIKYYKLYVLPVRDEDNTGSVALPQSGQKIAFFPGDDGDLKPGTPWPSARLVDNRDQTVTDRLTGLMWTQDANIMISRDPIFAGHWGRVEWTDALDYVAKLNTENYLGYSDWRLPNRIELLSLLDRSRSEYTLQQGHPFIHADMQNDSSVWTCWTSTTLGRNADSAWSVHFITGVSKARPKNAETNLWPVRTDSGSLPAGSIQGTITGPGISGEGVWINIQGPVNAFAKTDATGYYEFTHLPNGTYLLAPSYWYYAFAPVTRTVTVSGSAVTADFSASYNRAYGWKDISANLFSLENATGTSLNGLFFISDTEGWITSTEHIFHTVDGGETFEIQETWDYCNAIFMLNEEEGYAGGNNGYIYRTVDGGQNWNLLSTTGSYVFDISFGPGQTSGFCCGDNGQFWKITPTGLEKINTGLASTLHSVSSLSDHEAFIVGGNLISYYDGSGLTFLSGPVSGTNTAIHMVNDTLGWVAADGGGIAGFLRLDTPWIELKEIPHPLPSNLDNLYGLHSPNGKDVWAVGADGVIVHSPNADDFYWNSIYDFGNNTVWNYEIEGMTNTFLTNVFFTSPVNGYAVGNNGTILKYGLLQGAPEGADVLGFRISEQAGLPVIDPQNHTVVAEVNASADLTALIPELFLSAGATCDPPSGVSRDFSNPVLYRITAAGGAPEKVWTVNINHTNGIFETDRNKDDGVLVSPNPTRGMFLITNSTCQQADQTNPKIQIRQIEVMDLYGKVLETWNPDGICNAGIMKLDISNLPAGIYFVRLSLENQTVVKIIIKL
ncbi:MAG: DUF1566 domain-containing protein [Lentimicrobium sp.]